MCIARLFNSATVVFMDALSRGGDAPMNAMFAQLRLCTFRKLKAKLEACQGRSLAAAWRERAAGKRVNSAQKLAIEIAAAAGLRSPPHIVETDPQRSTLPVIRRCGCSIRIPVPVQLHRSRQTHHQRKRLLDPATLVSVPSMRPTT